MLRAFVIGDEKEEFRKKLEEAARIAELKQSITSLLDNMPGLSFSKDAETGVYLACNQAFAEYAHKADPEGVAGLTGAEIFDPVTASHFVEDDRMALSMDGPYIFFEDVTDAAGNPRQFQTTKLKFKDASGRLCILGMCSDVTDLVRIQRENATTKEAYEKARSTGIIYSHIAQALARGYKNIFYVNTESGEFIEYVIIGERSVLSEARRGTGFFESCIREADIYVFPDDRVKFTQAMDRNTLAENISDNKVFIMTYRLTGENGADYVNMKVSRMEDDDRFIVIGVTDVDEQMKQQKDAERIVEEHLAYASINALSGDYICIYTVDPETGGYREFSVSEGYESFSLRGGGADFFESVRDKAVETVYPEDLPRFLSLFTREGVLSEIGQSGTFSLSFRITVDGSPLHARLKAARLEENGEERLVVGLNDVDYHVRREKACERRIAEAQSSANIDALTGVFNRRAYLEAEKRLNARIAAGAKPEFSIVMLDVNDLKQVNDTQGHQSGDRYLREACAVIRGVFTKSSVFRVGGDEFAVIASGDDHAHAERLVSLINEHNENALKNGGVVIACGMSRFENDGSVASVFERADKSMYENKAVLKAAHAGKTD